MEVNSVGFLSFFFQISRRWSIAHASVLYSMWSVACGI